MATVLYYTRVHNINLYEVCSKVGKSFLRKGQFCLVIDFVKVARLLCRLTLPWRRYLSYRNQSIDLLYKSINWFLYDRDLRHERVKHIFFVQCYHVILPLQHWLYEAKHFVLDKVTLLEDSPQKTYCSFKLQVSENRE